jgi:hypothetical protein
MVRRREALSFRLFENTPEGYAVEDDGSPGPFQIRKKPSLRALTADK